LACSQSRVQFGQSPPRVAPRDPSAVCLFLYIHAHLMERAKSIFRWRVHVPPVRGDHKGLWPPKSHERGAKNEFES